MIAKKSKLLIGIMGVLAAVLILAVAGCGGKTQTPNETANKAESNASDEQVTLNGAGSSFDHPLFSTMFDEYSKVKPNIRVNYQPVGSGAGIKQLSDETVDFGATDAPMKSEEEKAAKGGEVLHIPITLGAVAISYNIPDVSQSLKLTPAVLTDIFLGKITKWNDPKIAADNAGVKLPNLAINIAHRSDGSGTTDIFTDYLSKVSTEWSSKVGKGKSVNWPIGVGGKGNSGVAAAIQQTPGTIGYVELAYAKQNDMPYAQIKNKAGQWVKPSLEGASAAADGAQIPDDMKVSIVDADGEKAYPISAFSWVILYKDQSDKTKGTALVELLDWMIHDGQNNAEALDYAKLPDSLVQREEAMLKTVTSQGESLLK